jgi:hypothetical protein
MYKCSFCEMDVTERMTRVVTATRPKTYDGGFMGWEIVTEKPSCRACVAAASAPLPSKFVRPLKVKAKKSAELLERRAA